MSISSIAGSAASWPSSSARQTKSTEASGTDGGASKLADLLHSHEPYDEVKVNLPNGMSVGIVHFGGGGLDSGALKSIEDFVSKLSNVQTSGQASNTDGTDGASNSDTPDTVGLDKVHVDLPNGISFDVLHSSGHQAMDSDAVIKELTDTAEELAEAFSRYSPASSAAAAYASSQATSSTSASQVDTQS
jgi:hypothetical protein